jgi:hypothetical protein
VTRYRGLILRLTGEGSWPIEYIRADANSDDRVDMSDAIRILGFLFVHEPPVLECRASADTNQSWDLDISDAVHLLSYLFLAGSPPPEPFPDCGSEDVEGNPLTCGSSAACPER